MLSPPPLHGETLLRACSRGILLVPNGYGSTALWLRVTHWDRGLIVQSRTQRGYSVVVAHTSVQGAN